MNVQPTQPTQRAERWLERATEQLSTVQRRLALRLRARLIRQCDPRDARLLLAQLGARRLLPASCAPQRVPTETGLDDVTRALTRLPRADRSVLMGLRGAGSAVELDNRAAALARRAAFRRLTETYASLRRHDDGVGAVT